MMLNDAKEENNGYGYLGFGGGFDGVGLRFLTVDDVATV